MKKTINLKPACYKECRECFFYFIDGCIALPGENCFMPITQKQAQLILNNQHRFNVSETVTQQLADKFPMVEIQKQVQYVNPYF
jgi:hypothetical protein